MNDKEINQSLWIDTVKIKNFPTLTRNITTNILVIGGGLCGIMTAYKLKEEGYKVVLVEAKKIGMQITARTTAFVSAQHDTMYHELVKQIGFKKAKLYLEANLKAVEEYKDLAKLYDFDYETVDSCFYSTDDIDIIQTEIETLKKMKYNAKFIQEIPLPINIKGGVVFANQGQMNALKLINCLTKELNIYENTEILKIKDNVAYTKNNEIKADKIIICTHFPIHNNILYSMRMHQMRSYVLAIDYKKEINGLYTEAKEGGLYFRKYKDYLIIGGNDVRTGKKSDCYQTVKNFVNKHFIDHEVKYYWANQDLVTLDDVAYIGNITSCNTNIYVATGFNSWGMTTSMIASNILIDLIKEKKNKYAKLYNPSRCMLNKSLFANMYEFIKNECKIKKKRCTHLGCTLTYNKCEKSWDCPCHGSRFTDTGEVLNDPAKKNLK